MPKDKHSPYVYGTAGDASVGKTLTLDEARRIAVNIAKLPKLLQKENARQRST